MERSVSPIQQPGLIQLPVMTPGLPETKNKVCPRAHSTPKEARPGRVTDCLSNMANRRAEFRCDHLRIRGLRERAGEATTASRVRESLPVAGGPCQTRFLVFFSGADSEKTRNLVGPRRSWVGPRRSWVGPRRSWVFFSGADSGKTRNLVGPRRSDPDGPETWSDPDGRPRRSCGGIEGLTRLDTSP